MHDDDLDHAVNDHHAVTSFVPCGPFLVQIEKPPGTDVLRRNRVRWQPPINGPHGRKLVMRSIAVATVLTRSDLA